MQRKNFPPLQKIREIFGHFPFLIKLWSTFILNFPIKLPRWLCIFIYIYLHNYTITTYFVCARFFFRLPQPSNIITAPLMRRILLLRKREIWNTKVIEILVRNVDQILTFINCRWSITPSRSFDASHPSF